jgi:hypothetical protein
MSTTDNNKLIAEFMGHKINFGFKEQGVLFSGQHINVEKLLYHTNWNWLMPVIEKILDISLNLDTMEMYYNITDCIPNITQTHIAVTDFIKWYNNENSK